jgi:uncharacterized protein (DUF427 family)
VKAVWNGKIIAEADKEDVIYIEGNMYFPPEAVNQDVLEKSTTPYSCPWKGDCQYYHVAYGDKKSLDTAWSYPHPLPGAIDRVKKDFSNYIAFWRDVEVRE